MRWETRAEGLGRFAFMKTSGGGEGLPVGGVLSKAVCPKFDGREFEIPADFLVHLGLVRRLEGW